MLFNLLMNLQTKLTGVDVAAGAGAFVLLCLGWLALRSFWGWYFKINEFLELLRAIQMELQRLNIKARSHLEMNQAEVNGRSAILAPANIMAAPPALKPPAPVSSLPPSPPQESDRPSSDLPFEEQMIRRPRVPEPEKDPEPLRPPSALDQQTEDQVPVVSFNEATEKNSHQTIRRCPLPQL